MENAKGAYKEFKYCICTQARHKEWANEVKKRLLMNGLEFDPTDVGALKSTLNRSFDVAKAVYRCFQKWRIN